jgi:hypothetical protein
LIARLRTVRDDYPGWTALVGCKASAPARAGKLGPKLKRPAGGPARLRCRFLVRRSRQVLRERQPVSVGGLCFYRPLSARIIGAALALVFSHAATISQPFRPSRFFMVSFVSSKRCHPCLLLKSERTSRQRSLNVRQTGSACARCLADTTASSRAAPVTRSEW